MGCDAMHFGTFLGTDVVIIYFCGLFNDAVCAGDCVVEWWGNR